MADGESKKHTNKPKCNEKHVKKPPEEGSEIKKNKPLKLTKDPKTPTKANVDQTTITKDAQSEKLVIEERFESLNKKMAQVMNVIDMNNISPSMLRTMFKDDVESEQNYYAEAAAAKRFVTTLSSLSRLSMREKKKLLDMYEDKLNKVDKLSCKKAMMEILQNANKAKELIGDENKETIKQETKIKVRPDNELLKEVPEVLVPKLKETKLLKIQDVCRNTVNLLKFERIHTATYIHDILPLLRSIEKEYRTKDISSVSIHEILVLDQITFNIDLYQEINNTEKIYRETLLDGHLFVTRHMTKLLETFQSSLNSSKNKDKDVSGNFLYLMDTALEKIYEIDVDFKKKSLNLKICEEVLEIVKEILCTAFSIALVSDLYRSNAIKGTSKTVLNDLDAIKSTISTKNKIMCNLMMDSFCDNLCSLERKINSAVLKLTVEIFACYEDKLKFLFNECNVNEKIDKNAEEFAKFIYSCIDDVDNEIDRLMEIGWFAISCSAYSKHSRELRNALAKIESLEAEFVPGLITMKKHANETYMKIVLSRLLEAIAEMQLSLYHIMDPHAFCLAVENQVETTIANFKAEIGKAGTFYKSHYKFFLTYYAMIQEMVDYSIITDQTSFDVEQLEAIAEVRQNEKLVLKEIEARLYQASDKHDDINLEYKILKRYKVLKHEFTKLRKLVYCYKKDGADEIVENKLEVEDIEAEVNNEKQTNVIIEYVEERAQKIVKNRSIIGNTPMKNKSLNLLKDNTKLRPLKLRVDEKRKSANTLLFLNKTQLNNEDLDITAVLNNICDSTKY